VKKSFSALIYIHITANSELAQLLLTLTFVNSADADRL
jgi:hypothetical protein